MAQTSAVPINFRMSRPAGAFRREVGALPRVNKAPYERHARQRDLDRQDDEKCDSAPRRDSGNVQPAQRERSGDRDEENPRRGTQEGEDQFERCRRLRWTQIRRRRSTKPAHSGSTVNHNTNETVAPSR